jgi:hypothetical protein
MAGRPLSAPRGAALIHAAARRALGGPGGGVGGAGSM